MSEVKQQTMTIQEFTKKHPEYIKKPKKKETNFERMRWLCQCKRGHMFDYRKRELYPPENKHYSPCQGKCPICGYSEFSFVNDIIYPIKWKFLGD